MDGQMIVTAAAVLIAVVALTLALRRRGESEGDVQASAIAAQIEMLVRQQAAAQSQLAERLQTQERALTKTLDDRLAEVTRRVGESLGKQAKDTADTMGDLKARLAVISQAQETISKLSTEVVSLQEMLSNKQARGAFGEVRLEDQVRDALPPSAYVFQAKLGNGRVADCLLTLPNPPGPIVIDAKFPLESYKAVRVAADDAARAAARRVLGTDVMKHVRDIAERYIVSGETATSALMFLPSEAVYAELHAELPDIVQKSHQARVYIVSPTTLMATLNTIRAVLRDAEMREQAHLIQKEVRIMAEDVGRLDKRVENLQRHFQQAEGDMRDIRISTEKVTKRAQRIEEVDLDDDGVKALPKLSVPVAVGESD